MNHYYDHKVQGKRNSYDHHYSHGSPSSTDTRSIFDRYFNPLVFWYQWDYLRSPAKTYLFCRVSKIGTGYIYYKSSSNPSEIPRSINLTSTQAPWRRNCTSAPWVTLPRHFGRVDDLMFQKRVVPQFVRLVYKSIHYWLVVWNIFYVPP